MVKIKELKVLITQLSEEQTSENLASLVTQRAQLAETMEAIMSEARDLDEEMAIVTSGLISLSPERPSAEESDKSANAEKMDAAEDVEDNFQIVQRKRAIRNFTKSSDSVSFFSHRLEQDKPLKIVVRSIHHPISMNTIKEDLETQRFQVENVSWMYRSRDRKPLLLLLLVTFSKNEPNKKIFKVKKILDIDVVFESPNRKFRVGQYHRCQTFRHSQKKCPRACIKTRETPATCANCGELHTASYRGCQKFPKPRMGNRRLTGTNNNARTNRFSPRRQPRKETTEIQPEILTIITVIISDPRMFLIFLVLVSSDDAEICSTPERTPGKCIQIRYCPPLLNILINKPISPLNLEYLEMNNCGFEGIHPKVCCSWDACMEPPKVDPVVVNSTNHDSDGVLPNVDECGFSTEDRIYNGIETQLATYSWSALLQYRTPHGLKFHCGGVLISKRYVLTAANCVSDKSIDSSWSLTSVRLGEHDLTKDPDSESLGEEIYYADPALNVQIERVIVHPLYNTETLAHDIALLKLAEDVTFSDYITPICMESTTENIDMISGSSSIVCGWNANKENEATENIKKKTYMTIEDNKKCGLSFVDSGIHLTHQLCATSSRAWDGYYGDTGGALHGFTARGQYYVIGIMSVRSMNSSSNNQAVIYSNVKEHLPWIIETLNP